MGIELKTGMKFLDIKTGIIWELADIAYGFGTSEESVWLKAVYVNADEDDVWISTSSMMPREALERRLRTGEWKQITNRKNNYY